MDWISLGLAALSGTLAGGLAIGYMRASMHAMRQRLDACHADNRQLAERIDALYMLILETNRKS